ncbi:MAG: alpha-hydroxy acid oxidase [Actinomycetota bacterium]|jgi:L-lactate dehydrogenase (cytochrome)|nr:alpha-hydroxy acid oxidase [Actinomycetota bacterium]
MRAKQITNVADARRFARRALPRVVFDYIDGAADDERTMHANESAFDDVALVPRMAVGGETPDLTTSVLGTSLSLPVLLAPCGLVRLMHPDGAVGVARAAAHAGTVSVLSTVAGSPVDEVAPAAPGLLWFQLYAPGGRRGAEPLLAKVAEAGVEVLVVTVDTPALGNRERDRRNGVASPLRIDARNAARLGPQILARPGWVYAMARSGIRFSPAHSVDGFSMLSMASSPFRWDDIAWLREQWPGKLVVKGVVAAADAAAAAERGADAVVVSNHGGRQLDGSVATLHALPAVVAAVGTRVEVLFDGGIRRGTHVAKALALGATAVMIGRPYLWGLAAGGEAGVAQVLASLRRELAQTLLLAGCPSVGDLDRSWITPAGFVGGLPET